MVPTFELVCSSSSGLTFTRVDMWGELCVELCAGSWGELSGVGELCKGNCVGSCGSVGGTAWGSWVGGCVVLCEGAVWGHAHQSPDGPAIHTLFPSVLPAQGGFPITLSPIQPLPSVPAHSSSHVVHCRVCPPHPLHAPVFVLHLAVYPASPTQGRVGLTDRFPHSAQTQCNPTR